MHIIRSDVLGFCTGVHRAVTVVTEESIRAKTAGERVYIFGPLVHNPNVRKKIKKNGVEEILYLDENIKGGSLVIRAHGIAPYVEEKLLSKGVRIVDATCHKVKNSQLKAQELAGAGYCLFLAGEHEHAEIKGILGYAELESSAPFCRVVGNTADAQKEGAALYEADKNAKTALLGQTTICEDEYHKIAEILKNYFPTLDVINTICSAAKDRQQALCELLDKVEAVIIAGGKESSNTRRLFAIAQKSGKPCVMIEDAREIPLSFYSYKTVGISAGASTPDFVINEIEKDLMR